MLAASSQMTIAHLQPIMIPLVVLKMVTLGVAVQEAHLTTIAHQIAPTAEIQVIAVRLHQINSLLALVCDEMHFCNPLNI